MTRFTHFAAIDWSGAAGERHAGIALALCPAGTAAPGLIRPGHRWSRGEVLDWLVNDLPADTLVGIDISTALAFADRGAYFPGQSDGPRDARALWGMVEEVCADDPHLGAGSFVDHPAFAPHFRRHGGREGALFGASGIKGGQGRMRLLHRLHGRLPLWPVDPLPAAGSVVVEIYTAIAAIAAGRPAGRSKMRDMAQLDAGLARLGSETLGGGGPIDDHSADAILAAAWLRRVGERREMWTPKAMTPALAATEGWTFGVS
jgi:hypothetical protein